MWIFPALLYGIQALDTLNGKKVNTVLLGSTEENGTEHIENYTSKTYPECRH